MKVAVIPARGGSKRIPRKNIRSFCGRPIIQYTITTAMECGIFDHILVSTDDEEVAEVATSAGAEIPFIRPSELADDWTGTTAVVAHAAKWMRSAEWPVSAICCMYATAPFMKAEDVRNGLKMLEAGNWLFTFSAARYSQSILRSFRVQEDGSVAMFFPENFSTRTQDLPDAYHDAGQFYWGAVDTWIEGKQIFESYSRVLVIPNSRVHDIDSEEDWTRAELIWSSIHASKCK